MRERLKYGTIPKITDKLAQIILSDKTVTHFTVPEIQYIANSDELRLDLDEDTISEIIPRVAKRYRKLYDLAYPANDVYIFGNTLVKPYTVQRPTSIGEAKEYLPEKGQWSYCIHFVKDADDYFALVCDLRDKLPGRTASYYTNRRFEKRLHEATNPTIQQICSNEIDYGIITTQTAKEESTELKDKVTQDIKDAGMDQFLDVYATRFAA